MHPVISIPFLILSVITWAGTKAIPAWWKQHVANHQTQVQQASNLCEQHNDCESQKIQSLQGMKPVVTLKTTPAKEAK